MSNKHPRRPRDPLQFGKLIGDISTGSIIEDKYIPTDEESWESLRGKKGGVQRAKNLSPEERKNIAHYRTPVWINYIIAEY